MAEAPFPPTFVINLPNRRDRLGYIKKEFAEWPVPIERVEAVQKKPGWKGCTQSHRKCIQLAYDRGYPWVLLVEDDCKLAEGAIQRFTSLLPFLWKRKEWDMFNGGMCFLNDKSVSIVSIINKETSIVNAKGDCSQFLLFPKRVFQKILADLSPTDPIARIDQYYKDNYEQMWTIDPFLATQRNDRSSLSGKITRFQTWFQQSQEALVRGLKTAKNRNRNRWKSKSKTVKNKGASQK